MCKRIKRKLLQVIQLFITINDFNRSKLNALRLFVGNKTFAMRGLTRTQPGFMKFESVLGINAAKA